MKTATSISIIVTAIGAVVIGMAIFVFFRSNPTSQLSNGQSNQQIENSNRGNLNNVTLVPRIVKSGKLVTPDQAISNPNTADWRQHCVTDFPCLKLPDTFSACRGVDTTYVVIENTPTCGSDSSEPIMNINVVDVAGTLDSVIPQTTELVARTFQNSSDVVTGSVADNTLYCLDDLQMRHCVVTFGTKKRYLVRGDYYFQQPDERTAYDGLVRSMLAQ